MKNELRIGNLVKDGNDFEQVTIYHLDCLSIGRCEFDPIPLTEEWLLKFGFIKSDEWYILNGYYASFDADYPLWFGQQGCCQYDTIKDGVKYVHELQNLYFALTNNELTINK